VGARIRGYIFHESLSSDNYRIAAKQSDTELTILIDGKRIQAEVTRGGIEFYWTIPDDQKESYVLLSINNWVHNTMFQIGRCLPPPENGHDSRSKQRLVMNLYTWDSPRFIEPSSIKRLADAIARHAAYHFCALSVDLYEVGIYEAHLPQYLENTYLLQEYKAGHVTFLWKGNHPAQLNVKSAMWQTVYENMAVLRYWMKPAKLLFWDPDEFLYYDPNKKKQLLELIQQSDVLSFSRMGVVRAEDNTIQCESDGLSFSNGSYAMVDKEIQPKISIDPNAAGCVYVHVALVSNRPTVLLDPNIAYLVHFENYFSVRIQPSPTMQPIDLSWLSHCEGTVLPANFSATGYKRASVPSRIVQHYADHQAMDFGPYIGPLVWSIIFVAGFVLGRLYRSKNLQRSVSSSPTASDIV
jgi:hypothetical protein